jgi:hypothetical protein
MMLLCLVLGACAPSAPRGPPLAISYRWGPTLPLAYDDQPPAEISIRWEPGVLSPKALEQLQFEQCQAWNRRPTPVEQQPDAMRFRCDKPLIPSSAAP